MHSKISEAKFKQFAGSFYIDLNAAQIAKVTGQCRNGVNRFTMWTRERMAATCEVEPHVSDEVSANERYIGARRVKVVRGRGTIGKTIPSISSMQIGV